MKRHLTRRFQLVGAALVALGLGGCHSMYRGGHHGGQPVDPSQPKVAVVDGKIVIDQEALNFPAGQGQVTITWTLPAQSKTVFDEKAGIRFDARAEGEIVNCRRGENNPQVFTCVNRHSRRGYYKYDINVVDEGKPINRDPFVWND